MLARQKTILLAALIAALIGFGAQSEEAPGSQQEQAKPEQSNQPSPTDQQPARQTPVIVNVYPPPTGGNVDRERREDEEKRILDRRLVDLTADLSNYTGRLYGATVALVIATILLVIATIGLLVVGYKQWSEAKQTADDAIEARRAHLSGGANRGHRSDTGDEVRVVTINNYGRTPATIGTVAATICEERELDAFPGWNINDWPGHPFSKGWKGYVFGEVSGQQTDVFFPYEANKVIAGRIWYRDIFKTWRSVGFLLKTDDLTAIGRNSFWEEREEQDPNQ
jgi:hypothetical protein